MSIETDLKKFWTITMILLLLASLAHGRTITVGLGLGYDYAKIQPAINAAQEGDVVVVAQGEYGEPIRFKGVDIILTSVDPNDVDCRRSTEIEVDGGSGPGVTFTGSESPACVIRGLTIEKGWAWGITSYGGGIRGNGTKATIRNCNVQGNRADLGGGGLHDCDGLIEGCSIEDNVVEAEDFIVAKGAGLYECDGIISNCIIAQNRAGDDRTGAQGEGGGLYGCNGKIVGCIIEDNYVIGNGGGLYNCAEVLNCTIVGNYVTGQGGAIYHDSDSGIVSNSIIWDNRAAFGGQILVECSSVNSVPWNLSIGYSNVQGGLGETIVAEGCKLQWESTNFDLDPLFARPGYWSSGTKWRHGDYHLLDGSPCIDAGNPVGDYGGQTDIDGQERLIGRHVDVGADEYEYVYVAPALVRLDMAGPGEVQEKASAQYAATAYYEDNSTVDVTNEAMWSAEPEGIGVVDANGLFTVGELDELVKLMVKVEYGEGQVVRDAHKVVLCVPMPEPTDIYYVDVAGGNDDNDGLSRDTAFKTIQRGINEAENGNTVLVYPGVYREEVRFKGKAITVGSAEDAAILENPGDFAVSFYSGEGPESTLENFVIRNSMTGISISGSSPTIRNLTIVDNKSGIEAYADSEPDIGNCIFWDNAEADLLGCEAQYSWIQLDVAPVLMDGLVNYWSFDETSGNMAYDIIGGQDGMIHGAYRAQRAFSRALGLDGIDDYVELPANEPVWLPLEDFTLSVWVYFDRDPVSLSNDSEVILDLNYGASSKPVNDLGYNIQRCGDSGKLCFHMTTTTNSDENLYSNEVLAAKKWYHIVSVREGEIQAIYVNGLLDESRTCSVDPIDFVGIYDDDRINIGRFTTNIGYPRYYLKGKIDDVMIFGRALSGEEIQQLYQSRLSGYGFITNPLFAAPSNDDYHLLSQQGRYWPEHKVWVLDEVTSPCIDGGNPEDDYSIEREPNGGRINMGAYGGTGYASMSEMQWLDGDINHDGIVNMIDLAMLAENWLQATFWAE
jgi:hypothetical protein